jgi:hypothetical protein
MLVARVAGMLKDKAPDQNIALSSLGGGLFGTVPPDMVAAQLNTQILSEVKGERYLTLCLGYLDQRTGSVRMVQAGHPPPLVLRQEGDVERLGTGGMPIGLLEDARYDTFEFRLRSGDKLLLYSDGLTECPLAVGGFLEEDGLIALCRKHGMARGEEMISRMAGDLVRMSGAVDFPDDASALLVEYDGRGLATQPHPLRDEMPVAGDGEPFASHLPWQEHGAVAVFGGLRPARAEAGGVDMALFLRVQVVFRHVGEAMEHADAPYAVDRVSGFLHHLAGKRVLRALAGVDPAAGQLQFRPRFFLERGENAVARVDDGIDAGAGRVTLLGQGRASETAVHGSSCCCRPRSCQPGGLSPR